jgi:hypothetical protein
MSDGDLIWKLVAAAAVLLNALLAVKLLMQKTQNIEIGKQPLRTLEETHVITAAHLGLTLENYATKTDLNDTERRLDKKITDVDSEAARRESGRVKGIHDRIDGISKQLSELVGEIREWRRRTP